MILLAKKKSADERDTLHCVNDYPPIFQRGLVLMQLLKDPRTEKWAMMVAREDGEVPTEADYEQAKSDFDFIQMPPAVRSIQ